MPTQSRSLARVPLIVDQDSLTNAVAGVVLDQLRDLFSAVSLTTNVTVPPLQLRLDAPAIPTPTFSFSPSINPAITLAPDIRARLDAVDLITELRQLRSDIASLVRAYAAPITRTVAYNGDGQIVSITETRS